MQRRSNLADNRRRVSQAWEGSFLAPREVSYQYFVRESMRRAILKVIKK